MTPPAPSDPGPSSTVAARGRLGAALRAIEELRAAPGWSAPQLRWLDEQAGRLQGMIEVLEQIR